MVYRGTIHDLEPKSKRMRTGESQVIGGQLFPPGIPVPEFGRNDPPARPPPSQSIGHGAVMIPESGNAADPHYVGCIDNARQATALLELVGPEEREDVSLVCLASWDTNDVLLAGGRKEINLKDPKWASAKAKTEVEVGVLKEYNNVDLDKQALVPLSVDESRRVAAQFPDRLVESRYVLVEKQDDNGETIVKGRWTARGDKDPDLFDLIRGGKTASPTISSNGRFVVLQAIASGGFQMQLGDVTGAFLEADCMKRCWEAVFEVPPQRQHPWSAC